MSSTMRKDVIALMPARRGHFLLESGHHGDLWLDLELLCLNPESVRRFPAPVPGRLAPSAIDVVCGPLAALPNNVWTPAECPLCLRGVPLANGLGPDPIGEPTR